jgi:hypothetical protein
MSAIAATSITANATAYRLTQPFLGEAAARAVGSSI